jgi:RNA polymerase sigma-70 factor (ECF subfamily)
MWYQPLIQKGFSFLEEATQNETSVYHLEAAIAYLHAVSPSFEATDWKAIYYLYELLVSHHPTPIIALNKAIAASYALTKEVALAELQQIKGLENYYLYYTAIGEVYFDLQHLQEAKHYYEKGLSITSSLAERQLLQEKINACYSMPALSV